MDEKLTTTIAKIKNLAQQNPEFDQAMRKLFGGTVSAFSVPSDTTSNSQLDEIYEYCISKILKEQAEQFYHDFPIPDIKNQLTEDYIRMEQFRRHNEFGDFCLSAFQQVEGIVNWFCHREKFIKTYEERFNEPCDWLDFNGQPFGTLGNLFIPYKFEENKLKKIDSPDFHFNNRLRAVIYFVSMGDNPNKYRFDTMYKQINDLYMCRNLNHRGGLLNAQQEGTINAILPHKYQYYLKFTGVLVDFVESINQYMAKKEINGRIIEQLTGMLTVKLEDGHNIIFDQIKHKKIYNKLKYMPKGTSIVIEYHMKTKEYLDAKVIG